MTTPSDSGNARAELVNRLSQLADFYKHRYVSTDTIPRLDAMTKREALEVAKALREAADELSAMATERITLIEYQHKLVTENSELRDALSRASEWDAKTADACAVMVETFKRDASFDDSMVGAQEHNANQANIAAVIRSRTGEGK